MTDTPVEPMEPDEEVMSVVMDGEEEVESNENKEEAAAETGEAEESRGPTETSREETLAEVVEEEAEAEGAVGGVTDAPEQNSQLPKHNFDHLNDNVTTILIIFNDISLRLSGPLHVIAK